MCFILNLLHSEISFNWDWICNNYCNKCYFKTLINCVRSLQMYARFFLVYSKFLEATQSCVHYCIIIYYDKYTFNIRKMSFIYLLSASLWAGNCFGFSQCFESNVSTVFNHPHLISKGEARRQKNLLAILRCSKGFLDIFQTAFLKKMLCKFCISKY